MSVYTYNRDDLIDLLEEAQTVGNLAANLGISRQTILRLVASDVAYPTQKTINKIKPFALGLLDIEIIVRPYKKRGSGKANPEPQKL